MSIYRVVFNFASHDLENNMPNFGGMSATTTSMTKFFDGI